MIKGYFVKLKDGFLYSCAGFLVAIKETAFQLELLLGLPAVIFAMSCDVSKSEKAMLVSSVLLVFIAEAINTAIERTVDRISLASHPVSRKAKDVGSFVVFLTAANAVIVWLIILFAFQVPGSSDCAAPPQSCQVHTPLVSPVVFLPDSLRLFEYIYFI